MLENYKIAAGSYDEMLSADGSLNEPWKEFIDILNSKSKQTIDGIVSETNRILQDNGVTYNIHGDPEGINRPWKLDPVPLIIGENDWAVIEKGLKQRAKLLNFILKDVYGPRKLIKDGLLPLDLIYNHNGFLQPCDNNEFNYIQDLYIYSVDIARGPDGCMWVINDRTQAPSGLGYAVENRTAMAKVYPNIIRDLKVHRLSSFFRDLRSILSSIKIDGGNNPRIVLLTPGPYNETYFEHAYLSNYLGYPLVQGHDLTVRNNKVWFKSIDGLHKVDIIIRRVDDNYCDPLELKSDSQLGVPGLLESIRKGNVIVINPLGSSILENPGLYPFLPLISKHYFGEDLILPNAATWWCGHKKERNYVFDNFDNIVIKMINRDPDYNTTFVGQLSHDQKEELKYRILKKPYQYVGQEMVGFSTAPSLINGQLNPRFAVIRSFLVKNENSEYSIMPGGLVRSSFDEGNPYVSNQFGGFAKDAWVISDKPEQHISLWLKSDDGTANFSDTGLLSSKYAENLYWLGRYAERAESSSHFIRIILERFFELHVSSREEKECFVILLKALTYITYTFPGFTGKDSKKLISNPVGELFSLILDYKKSGSIAFNLKSFRNNAYSVRDRWSVSTWKIINSIDKYWQGVCSNKDLTLNDLHNNLEYIHTLLMAFAGHSSESMTRKSGWIMLEFGRRLERSLLLISFIRSTIIKRNNELIEYLLLEALLVRNESLITYRMRYRQSPRIKEVLELLLLDDSNPRSLIYQIERIQQYMSFLPHEDKSVNKLSHKEKLILSASTQLKMVDVDYLTQSDNSRNSFENLNNLLASVESTLMKVSDALSHEFFTHIPHTTQLVNYYIFKNEIQNNT
jgi:uncharacterized circularly permuted ATP-grasp superfamily protein/uncharacterized alpha-E superfamily protein